MDPPRAAVPELPIRSARRKRQTRVRGRLPRPFAYVIVVIIIIAPTCTNVRFIVFYDHVDDDPGVAGQFRGYERPCDTPVAAAVAISLVSHEKRATRRSGDGGHRRGGKRTR